MVKWAMSAGAGCVVLGGLVAAGCDVETQGDKRMETVEDYTRAMETLSNWGRWGDDDQLGAANLITPDNRPVALAVAGRARTPSAQGRSIWDGIYSEAQAQRGEGLYRDGCAECHGEGLEGGEMEPALVGGEFMWGWSGQSVGELFERIRVSMPPGQPSTVSREEKADVLAFLLAQNGVPPGEVDLAGRTSALRGITFQAEPPR